MKPVLQALILAEKVYEDKSGKKIICGTFTHTLFGKKPPVREVTLPDGTKQQVAGGLQGGSPCAFVSLTDVCQGTQLTFQFVNVSKNIALFGMNATLNCEDRLQTVELVLPLPILPITESGIYAFEVLCEGSILGSYRIVANELIL